jgi:hypothetical protein
MENICFKVSLIFDLPLRIVILKRYTYNNILTTKGNNSRYTQMAVTFYFLVKKYLEAWLIIPHVYSHLIPLT